MENNRSAFKFWLGLFVTLGTALFVGAIFIIGKQKNLFNPVFSLQANFYNVSGLQVGNKVRFSGINVGSVDRITIVNDSTVRVDMVVQQEVQKFIKTDCEVSIGSEGIIGDRVLNISQSEGEAPPVKSGQRLQSAEPIETDAIMASLQLTIDNAATITGDLSEVAHNINKGNGTLSRLIKDPTIARNLSQTMRNLSKSSKGLEENMEAAKDNILLRGYFKRKERAARKKKEAEEERRKEAREQKSRKK